MTHCCDNKKACSITNVYCCGNGSLGSNGDYDRYVIGEEVETNILFNGKKVYRKLIDCGTFPQSNGSLVTKQVDTGLDPTKITYTNMSNNFYASGILLGRTIGIYPIPATETTGTHIHIMQGDPKYIVMVNSHIAANSWTATSILEYTKNDENPIESY